MTYQVYLPMVSGGLGQYRPSAFDEINSWRRLHKVPPLVMHDGLMTSAQITAEFTRQTGVPKHTEDWLSRILPHYPNWFALAELLAAGYHTAADAIHAFYYSQSHRDAMLSSLYDEVGIGMVYDGTRHGYWWCVHLGTQHVPTSRIHTVRRIRRPRRKVSVDRNYQAGQRRYIRSRSGP